MLSEVWDRRLCLIIFVLLAAQSAVATLWFGGVGGISQGIVMLLACMTVIAWVFIAWRSPSAVALWPVLGWLASAALIYVTFRYWSAEIEYVARREWLLFLTAGSQFLVALDLFHRRPEYRRWIVFVFAGLATVASLLALFQFFGSNPTVWGAGRAAQYGTRGSGTFINPNHFAAFIELALFPTLALLFLGRFGVVGRLVLGYVVLLMGAGLVVSVSRGAYAATGGGIILFLALMACLPRHRMAALVFIGCLLLAGVVAVVSSPAIRVRLNHFSEVVKGRDDDARMKIWRSAWKVHQEAPEWGVGPGHFEFRYFKHRSPHYQQSAIHAHNDWLNILVDYGWWGFTLAVVLLLGLLTAFGRRVLQLVRARGDTVDRRPMRLASAVGAGLAVLIVAVHGLVDFLIYIPALLGGMALFSAAAAAPDARAGATPGKPWMLILKRGQMLILLAIVVPLGCYGLRLIQEARQLRLAARADSPSAARLGYLERASEIEPNNDRTLHLIGEHHREIAVLGDENWQEQTQTALRYFEAASRANPYRHENWLKIGFCQDWQGNHEAGGGAFAQAQLLDPNGSITMAWMGWHLCQSEQYQAAIDQLGRSLNHLPADRNPFAAVYLKHAQDRLAKAGVKNAKD